MAPTDEEVFESYKREMKSLQTMKSIQSMPTAGIHLPLGLVRYSIYTDGQVIFVRMVCVSL